MPSTWSFTASGEAVVGNPGSDALGKLRRLLHALAGQGLYLQHLRAIGSAPLLGVQPRQVAPATGRRPRARFVGGRQGKTQQFVALLGALTLQAVEPEARIRIVGGRRQVECVLQQLHQIVWLRCLQTPA